MSGLWFEVLGIQGLRLGLGALGGIGGYATLCYVIQKYTNLYYIVLINFILLYYNILPYTIVYS